MFNMWPLTPYSFSFVVPPDAYNTISPMPFPAQS